MAGRSGGRLRAFLLSNGLLVVLVVLAVTVLPRVLRGERTLPIDIPADACLLPAQGGRCGPAEVRVLGGPRTVTRSELAGAGAPRLSARAAADERFDFRLLRVAVANRGDAPLRFAPFTLFEAPRVRLGVWSPGADAALPLLAEDVERIGAATVSGWREGDALRGAPGGALAPGAEAAGWLGFAVNPRADGLELLLLPARLRGRGDDAAGDPDAGAPFPAMRIVIDPEPGARGW